MAFWAGFEVSGLSYHLFGWFLGNYEYDVKVYLTYPIL